VQITTEEAEGAGNELLRAAALVCRALDQAPSGFLIARFDGECLAVNATYAGWLRPPLEPADLAGLSLLADADRCPEIMLALRAAAAGDSRVIDGDRAPLLRNRQGHFRVHVLPFRVTGEVLAATIMVEDITEHALIYSAFEASERRFRQVVECASDGIVVHRNDRVLYSNPSALKLLGRESGDDLIGLPVAELFYRDDDRQSFDCNWAARGSSAPIERRLVRSDGSLISVGLRAVRTSLDDGLASFLVFRPLFSVAESSSRPPANATVLVCDDEERLAVLTAALLEQQGYRALVASGADSAASVAAAQALDVLVLDVNLACSSASAVLERVAERGFRGPTVLTSGYPEEDVPRELLRHPRVTGYVAKPYSVERLVAAIDHALERDRPSC
jgi:PAS domain S-box-containing protein